MKLTQHTDYSLRVLLYLAGNEGNPSIGTIADYYGISKNHLVKVAHELTKLGFVKSIRGRSGGLRLQMKPADIVVGSVVRHMEPNFTVVECFNKQTNTCRISSVCKLKDVMAQAMNAFMAHLDSYTLAELALQNKGPNKEDLIAVNSVE
tara:strand:- start:1208 stop:1654 length:447 start_codon:yes stop_codon:yes gene_type:complete